MRAFPVLLSLLFMVSVSLGCYDANWWDVLDKSNVWAKCDANAEDKYIRGFWRSAQGWIWIMGYISDDRVGRLEQARCCSPPASYTSSDAGCVKANWWSSLDRDHTWSKCPNGYYLNGIYKSGGQWLHNIEEGNCCKPAGHPTTWGQCYEQDVSTSFDNEGWSECHAGFYMVGIYRGGLIGGCDSLYCIEQFYCCKMQERAAQL